MNEITRGWDAASISQRRKRRCDGGDGGDKAWSSFLKKRWFARNPLEVANDQVAIKKCIEVQRSAKAFKKSSQRRNKLFWSQFQLAVDVVKQHQNKGLFLQTCSLFEPFFGHFPAAAETF